MLRRVLLLSALVTQGCATHAIEGAVLDRNGQPLDRVIISLKPGNVQLVTDSTGTFVIDYLRDESGERTKLEKRTEYEVEAFKVGYHVETTKVTYKRGELVMEPLTLKEDTIRVEGSDMDLDPALYPDRSHSSGATYEGE